MTPAKKGLERAISAAGGVTALAHAMGFEHQWIQQWRKGGRVPWWHVDDVAYVTKIPKHELRPDLYDAPSEKRAHVGVKPNRDV